jgi:hypothetical protein
MSFSKKAAAAFGVLLLLTGLAEARTATLEDVENSFYPYRNGAPQHPGLKPGTVITAANVASFRDSLDPALADLITKGSVEITIGKTTSFAPHKAYVEATRAHLNQVTLGDEPGVINNYISGRPFPAPPSLDDPRAGDKIAWNFRYAYSGDSGAVTQFIWQYVNMRKGKVERTLKMRSNMLTFKHRLIQPPVPDLPKNDLGIYQALYLYVQSPNDLRNTQLLIYKLDDDRARDRSWMYLNTFRRVRPLSTGQTTDAFLGSDIMIEDFLGYNGRLKDMVWTFKGETNVLLAYFNHDEMPLVETVHQSDNFKFIGFHGQGGCFPNVTWQLRKAYMLEAKPRDPDHPISKRLYYVDVQTHTMSLGRIYDQSGKLWKLAIGGFSHPDHHHPKNKGTGVNIIDVASMIDLQAERCTRLQFKTEVDPKLSPRSMFSVQYMRTQGR